MIRGILGAVLALALSSPAAAGSISVSQVQMIAQPANNSVAATVMVFAGQSNEEAHGSNYGTFSFGGVPGGAVAPSASGAAAGMGIKATASCYETTATLSGASSGTGTLTCAAPSSGLLYAGEVITSGGVAGQSITAGNNGGNFPGATGTPAGGGTFVVNSPSAIGSSGSPVAMTFAEPDIGGSGTLNTSCQIWVPGAGSSAGSWQAYNPGQATASGISSGNADPQLGTPSQAFGPEGAICQRWTAANAGKTLYMIKSAIGGSSLCMLTSGNNYSPEYQGSGTAAAFSGLQSQVALAEAALGSQFGITNYAITMFQWGQGEQDSQANGCGMPGPPFASTLTPVPYLANLQDLVGRLAIPTAISASFTGSVSGSVLTVSAVASGTIHQYQAVSGAGVDAGTYVASFGTGTGGTGTYNLQVYQATAFETITSSSGAVCTSISGSTGGQITGQFFVAYPQHSTSNTITTSCVSGGSFGVGNVLTGTGVLSGTVITGLDSAGHTADGIYTVNVNQTVASEAMTATVPGFGTGASTAKFVMFQTFGAGAASGVQIGQDYVNDNAVTALTTRTVNTNDVLKATSNQIHYHASWIAELGRRLYTALVGGCDYHSPTC